MIRFLPDAAHAPAHYGWYTSCFLGVPRKLTGDAVPQRRTEQHGNQAFLRNNLHLAFHQKVDLMALSINEKEVLSFSRALRMLDMEPSFHLTELETSLATSTGDDALSQISDAHLDGWPPVSKVPIHEKKEALETYIKQKNDEVRTQQWPQLMLMATSDAVAPNPISE
ncbi:hypothetical protein E8E11_010638 [Didymella keratinophila]|nr:hypothetical protein E8E11_010638 [Didymella keratinophila]